MAHGRAVAWTDGPSPRPCHRRKAHGRGRVTDGRMTYRRAVMPGLLPQNGDRPRLKAADEGIHSTVDPQPLPEFEHQSGEYHLGVLASDRKSGVLGKSQEIGSRLFGEVI